MERLNVWTEIHEKKINCWRCLHQKYKVIESLMNLSWKPVCVSGCVSLTVSLSVCTCAESKTVDKRHRAPPSLMIWLITPVWQPALRSYHGDSTNCLHFTVWNSVVFVCLSVCVCVHVWLCVSVCVCLSVWVWCLCLCVDILCQSGLSCVCVGLCLKTS